MTKTTIYRLKRLDDHRVSAEINDGGPIIKKYLFGVSKKNCFEICASECCYIMGHCEHCTDIQERLSILGTIEKSEVIYILNYSEEKNIFGNLAEKRFSFQDLREAVCEKICDSERPMSNECLDENKFCYIKGLLKKEIKREDG